MAQKEKVLARDIGFVQDHRTQVELLRAEVSQIPDDNTLPAFWVGQSMMRLLGKYGEAVDKEVISLVTEVLRYQDPPCQKPHIVTEDYDGGHSIVSDSVRFLAENRAEIARMAKVNATPKVDLVSIDEYNTSCGAVFGQTNKALENVGESAVQSVQQKRAAEDKITSSSAKRSRSKVYNVPRAVSTRSNSDKEESLPVVQTTQILAQPPNHTLGSYRLTDASISNHLGGQSDQEQPFGDPDSQLPHVSPNLLFQRFGPQGLIGSAVQVWSRLELRQDNYVDIVFFRTNESEEFFKQTLRSVRFKRAEQTRISCFSWERGKRLWYVNLQDELTRDQLFGLLKSHTTDNVLS